MGRRKRNREPCVCYNLLVEQGAVVEPLSEKETDHLRERWRETFGVEHAKAAHVPLTDQHGYDWHVFSYNIVQALEGDLATAEYLKRNHTELVVLPHPGTGLPGARCRCDRVPRLDEAADVYVAPDNFAWTMVYTHEKGWLGPYFCKAAWVHESRKAKDPKQ